MATQNASPFEHLEQTNWRSKAVEVLDWEFEIEIFHLRLAAGVVSGLVATASILWRLFLPAEYVEEDSRAERVAYKTYFASESRVSCEEKVIHSI